MLVYKWKENVFINHIILNSSSNNTLSNIKSQRIMNNWYAFHFHELAVSFNVSISDETNPKSFPFLIIHKGRIFMARHTRFSLFIISKGRWHDQTLPFKMLQIPLLWRIIRRNLIRTKIEIENENYGVSKYQIVKPSLKFFQDFNVQKWFSQSLLFFRCNTIPLN